jgi:hypothetical protein
MCGIARALDMKTDPMRWREGAMVARSLPLRRPDGSGVWWDGLAVLDSSARV